MVAARLVTERLWNGHVEAAAGQQEKQPQHGHIEEQHQREHKALPARHAPQSSGAGIAGVTLRRNAEIVVSLFGKCFQVSIRHAVGLVMLQWIHLWTAHPKCTAPHVLMQVTCHTIVRIDIFPVLD